METKGYAECHVSDHTATKDTKGAHNHPGIKETLGLPGPKLPFVGMQPKNFFQSRFGQILLFKPIIDYVQYLVFDNGLSTYLENTAAFLAKRPYLTMPLFTLGLTLMTPVLAFVMFAFLTAAVTFTGFVIAEGAILSMGGVIVACFLLSIFGVAVAGCTMFSVIYFALYKVGLVK